MKTSFAVVCVCLGWLFVGTGSSTACNPVCRVPVRAAPAGQPVPERLPVPRPQAEPNAAGDGIEWDLPPDVGAKAPARPATKPPSVVRPVSTAALNSERPATPAREGVSFNERMTRAVAAQNALAAENKRLARKRAEIERWNEQDQAKFLQAFGTTDDRARQAVLARIDQLLDRNTKAMAQISEAVNLEFYLATKKRQQAR